MKAPAHSLRKRLSLLLLIAIAAGAMIQAASAYVTALEETDEIFDSQMRQIAAALSTGPLLVSEGARARDDPEDHADFAIQIWSDSGALVHQSRPGLGLPRPDAAGFARRQVEGETYRVFVARKPGRTVQIAQNESSRREIAVGLAGRFIVPIFLLAPPLMFVVWWMVTRSLAPLQRIRTQVSRRRAEDLSMLPEDGLPDEIAPLVSELNLLFSRAQSAFEARQSFVANAAHELRSPLTALHLQAQAVHRAATAEARELAIRRLLAGVDRATRLVEQLLFLAREEAQGQIPFRKVTVDLADVARRTLSEEAPRAEARGVCVELEIAGEPMVAGEPASIAILMRNLIDNAIKHTPPGGKIALRLLSARTPTLAIEDSGPGIPAEERGRVFDRFYRVAGSDTAGSGLGLSIVESVAKRHGASVHLARSALLGGLQVTVVFPDSSLA